MLFFNPDACKQYQSFAYLEVIGKEERLQLNLVGNGLAPVVTLNVEFLNVNEIFVNLVHRYEIVAFNKGFFIKRCQILENSNTIFRSNSCKSTFFSAFQKESIQRNRLRAIGAKFKAG